MRGGVRGLEGCVKATESTMAKLSQKDFFVTAGCSKSMSLKAQCAKCGGL